MSNWFSLMLGRIQCISVISMCMCSCKNYIMTHNSSINEREMWETIVIENTLEIIRKYIARKNE